MSILRAVLRGGCFAAALPSSIVMGWPGVSPPFRSARWAGFSASLADLAGFEGGRIPLELRRRVRAWGGE